jgi:poly(beta-D-mannuronate) lyase
VKNFENIYLKSEHQMIRRFLLLFFFTLTALSATYAKSIKVTNMAQYNNLINTLIAGDSIVLANGVWNDAQLIFKGKGEKGKYIYLIAETPGNVTLEGESCLQLSGEWLYVFGLVFVNGHTPRKTVIDFRTSSKEFAFNCVLMNCVIDNYNQPSKTSADHWVELWGKNNTVEYCYFGGKNNEGTTLVIWPDDINSINNRHLVYRNFFGYRPALGVNGGETIRVGTSDVCLNNSESVIEGNYFEQCNGETEIISNKSGENQFLNNTFFECEGSLTLRHGNRAVVSGNWFIGNGKANTGGIRIINEGHQIYNNYFYKLRGKEFRSALAIMNAIPNSPANGYAPVKNVIVANNTFFECSLPWNFCVGAGERNRTILPESTLLINNLVYCPNESELIKSYGNTVGITLDNNLMVDVKGYSKSAGAVSGKVISAKLGSLEIPYSTVIAKSSPFLKIDILGQTRTNAVVGAFQNKGDNPKTELASAGNCGPLWYKPIQNTFK